MIIVSKYMDFSIYLRKLNTIYGQMKALKCKALGTYCVSSQYIRFNKHSLQHLNFSDNCLTHTGIFISLNHS